MVYVWTDDAQYCTHVHDNIAIIGADTVVHQHMHVDHENN